ncbi:MAG: HD domain-containing protein [Roseateles sp.]|jgi:phosphonate degradation associated HDIG domain protein|nr:phosphohydrolase [Methylibium sp.]MBY0368984.1 HD domain-containing protein [Burkholderiaceae bacterium]|mmetsp:Transcript_7827/g.14766  ORF Transcript_7827/g.14766 Transcript_7827/m.14766 type:complete len:183 (-) Transcript_7827:348-896(-)
MKHRDDVMALFERLGHLEYAGEGVTQWQHAWQCGQLALRAQASPALQAAAWLHDIGHLLDGETDTPTLHGHDDRHEARAAALLRPWFGAAVADPVALHVEAKRYLVATQADYAARLSADSQRSLALQGGPMPLVQAQAWRERPHADDALRLRVWDDLAKDPAWRPASRALAMDELASLLAHL